MGKLQFIFLFKVLTVLGILIFSTLIHAAPKVYSSLGNGLEVLQSDCIIYQKKSIVHANMYEYR